MSDTEDADKTSKVVNLKSDLKKAVLLGNRRKLRKITFMFPNQTQNNSENKISCGTAAEGVRLKKTYRAESVSNVACDIIEHI